MNALAPAFLVAEGIEIGEGAADVDADEPDHPLPFLARGQS
jgi:hypothetical protein